MLSKSNVGIDLVYMPRLLNKLDDSKFINKVLTLKELEIFNSLDNQRRKLEFISGRFACKEAYAKALKKGIGKIDFKDFEVLKDENNAPFSSLVNAQVSISHDEDYAIAIVVVGDKSE
ncbi:holo-[acyl-carrier protein] synthase [Bacilli bacterium PM5-3]|nr:holo-[acyl-carrier protein] synthase [Bacilli bacterium PM5-3]